MEERIQDFTALVEVLQNEAEDLALDTAAAVRGVRTGTKTLAAEGGSSTSGSPLPPPVAHPADPTADFQDPYGLPSSPETDEAEE
jgi:hypothetical protein